MDSATRRDKAWSDEFLPYVKWVVACAIYVEAPAEEDMENNTDLIMIPRRCQRIAARVRREEYIRFWDEITIRLSRPGGATTEAHKMHGGFGDLYVYGIAQDDNPPPGRGKLQVYTVLDSAIVAEWWNAFRNPPGTLHNNPDGTRFVAIKIADLPTDAILLTNYADKAAAA